MAGQQVASAMPHERHPYPCQRAYGNFRRHILKFLTKPGRSRLFDGTQRTVMVGFLLLDMPVRWLMDLFDAVSGNRGYLAVGSILAAYLAEFGLIDTKSTQEETRASVERSLFITLVSSGNAASFVAAMKDFGSTQTMPATEHPSLLKFWEWGRTDQPNREPMLHWAQWRLELCSEKTKDCSLTDDTRLDLNGANLIAGDRMISIDNCENPLGGQLICQLLTQSLVKVRVLGLSKLVIILNLALFAPEGRIHSARALLPSCRSGVVCSVGNGCRSKK